MNIEKFLNLISVGVIGEFNEKILVKLLDATSFEGVWITGIPELNKSADGTFAGQPESELFFDYNNMQYRFLQLEEIDDIVLIQPYFLKMPD